MKCRPRFSSVPVGILVCSLIEASKKIYDLFCTIPVAFNGRYEVLVADIAMEEFLARKYLGIDGKA